MFCIPDLNDPSSLRIAFEKYSNFPKGSHLWTDRSKIVSVTGSDNSSSYRGKIQKQLLMTPNIVPCIPILGHRQPSCQPASPRAVIGPGAGTAGIEREDKVGSSFPAPPGLSGWPTGDISLRTLQPSVRLPHRSGQDLAFRRHCMDNEKSLFVSREGSCHYLQSQSAGILSCICGYYRFLLFYFIGTAWNLSSFAQVDLQLINSTDIFNLANL